MTDRVVLVDWLDRPMGTEEKLAAHRDGRLHRALSVLVVNDAGELLLQRRADTKYHSAGLWSNTCCSHPRPDEAVEDAAHRRLQEEMGFDCDLDPAFAFVYRAELGDGLIEHEYDHVFLGRWNGSPTPDPDEASDWRWTAPEALRDEIARHPGRFTYWFRVIIRELDDRDIFPGPSHEEQVA
ncbi:MAG: isopentenyl-diphosphate Delta-isomerase [Gemmatimonadota bacterium]|jgi:isopentenyl-diphosphate delta-isomerase